MKLSNILTPVLALSAGQYNSVAADGVRGGMSTDVLQVPVSDIKKDIPAFSTTEAPSEKDLHAPRPAPDARNLSSRPSPRPNPNPSPVKPNPSPVKPSAPSPTPNDSSDLSPVKPTAPNPSPVAPVPGLAPVVRPPSMPSSQPSSDCDPCGVTLDSLCAENGWAFTSLPFPCYWLPRCPEETEAAPAPSPQQNPDGTYPPSVTSSSGQNPNSTFAPSAAPTAITTPAPTSIPQAIDNGLCYTVNPLYSAAERTSGTSSWALKFAVGAAVAGAAVCGNSL